MKKLQHPQIAFFGSDAFVIPVLQALEANFEVVLVVTTSGSAIEIETKKIGIVTLTPDELDSEFIKNHRFYLESDLFVLASYGKIIPKAILEIPKFGALNIHPSLLPKYRGPSPVPTTILNGDKETGVTIIKMDEQMDHGPIIAAEEISLSGQEIMPELINKLFQIGAELLVGIIPDYIAGKLKPVGQNHTRVLFCPLIKKKDGYFDINNPPSPEILDRMIRAYYPWPGVWTRWNNRIVKFLPGNMLQMEGKKAISFKDFLNGYPDFPLKSIT